MKKATVNNPSVCRKYIGPENLILLNVDNIRVIDIGPTYLTPSKWLKNYGRRNYGKQESSCLLQNVKLI